MLGVDALAPFTAKPTEVFRQRFPEHSPQRYIARFCSGYLGLPGCPHPRALIAVVGATTAGSAFDFAMRHRSSALCRQRPHLGLPAVSWPILSRFFRRWLCL
jgi:hypothetical protein